MKTPVKEELPSCLASLEFDLPYTSQKIRLNDKGAQQVADIACKVAVEKASPIERDAHFANRFAAFIAGMLAAQCVNEQQRSFIFQVFLTEIEAWLRRECTSCEDENDWGVLEASFERNDEDVYRYANGDRTD